ncbi:MAG: hypothetical protein U0836_15275 [Pirellulales bacterium]
MSRRWQLGLATGVMAMGLATIAAPWVDAREATPRWPQVLERGRAVPFLIAVLSLLILRAASPRCSIPRRRACRRRCGKRSSRWWCSTPP